MLRPLRYLEGLHHLENCFVADEDLRGRNVLQIPRPCYVNCFLYSALALCCIRLQPLEVCCINYYVHTYITYVYTHTFTLYTHNTVLMSLPPCPPGPAGVCIAVWTSCQ